jgi:translation initiation factor IF-3
MEVVGKIKVVNAENVISEKYKKREVVVVTDEQYPQSIMIEFVQDKCDLLNLYKEGDSVKVSINLRGREWVNPEGVSKYFNTIQGWRIEKHAVVSASESYLAGQQIAHEPVLTAEEGDDLPF